MARRKMVRKQMTIPVDLHPEVLKFLPSKSLLRFRCVSKSWNLTILDPKFARLHTTISRTRPGATTSICISVAHHSYGRVFNFFNINHQREAIHEHTIDTSEFELNETSINFLVTPIVNGLLCFYKEGQALICNITTREIISLPTQPLIGAGAFYRLGYDPLHNEYKVLCFWGDKFMVFTIGKDKEWRDVIDPIDPRLYPDFFVAVVDHEGAICWLGGCDRTEMQKFVAFDVREEIFWITSLPVMPKRVMPDPELGSLRLVKIGRCIALCAAVMGGSNLFILEDYKNQVWVKRNIRVPVFFNVIGSVENKVIFKKEPCKVFSFDPNNGEVLPFEISGFDHMIQESDGHVWLEICICEIVENIYPLRRN